MIQLKKKKIFLAGCFIRLPYGIMRSSWRIFYMENSLLILIAKTHGAEHLYTLQPQMKSHDVFLFCLELVLSLTFPVVREETLEHHSM